MDDLGTGDRSLKVREKLGHPIIDSDGHTSEYDPIFLEYLAQVGGPKIAERYCELARGGASHWYELSPEEREDRRVQRPPFWIIPAGNTMDRATAMLPGLMRARMDNFGIDFSVIYTSKLHVNRLADEEIRKAGSRALNLMHTEMFADHADRMTPAAVIPTHTPEEAIAELEFCVNELGFKSAMVAGIVRRPVPIIEREAPEVSRYATWIDPLALGSPHDYDPLWQKFVDLNVAVTSHTSGIFGSRATTVNFTYNHIGHFASSNEAFCKAIFMGGVTRRFPNLKFGFLEGGANWATNLYNDLVEHWEKRNLNALNTHLNPDRVDRELLASLAGQYGGRWFENQIDDIRANGDAMGSPEDPESLDEFGACEITCEQDIYDLFVPNFHFGCEADDRMNGAAFNAKANHMGARLKAVFSSDVSHWDVQDMSAVVAEAYELVERGLLSEGDFDDMTFGNPISLHASQNPDFFKGTVVEDAVAAELAKQ
jgi:predicted TIM-barrel fold metal-dependent hydrolase